MSDVFPFDAWVNHNYAFTCSNEKAVSIPSFLYTCKAAAHGSKKKKQKKTLHISLKGSRPGNKKGLRIMASELIQPQ